MNTTLQWHWHAFDDLTPSALYAILRLRSEVFVVEQRSIFQDMDKVDLSSLHVCGYDESGELVAYARCIPSGIKYAAASIGRVVTSQSVRGTGMGHVLVRQSIACVDAQLGGGPIRISAQAHLQAFYAQHGFIADGDLYLEDDIPHQAMERI
ncbi:MAG: GNAT family N-acetyltransferase [Betaproteobacteria bacterium]|nr:GNAT family N-acetyltransferase [Betaproteobacteria bacterium]